MQAAKLTAAYPASKRIVAVLILAAMVLSSLGVMSGNSEMWQPAEPEDLTDWYQSQETQYEANPAPPPELADQFPQPIFTSADGQFVPARSEPGEAKVLLVDDDMERWMSGPWLETLIEGALNDGGYSYDVFRAGNWGGTNYEFPSGDEGLSIMDDYELLIWYGGWQTSIITASERSVIESYLDGDDGTEDSFSTDNRNILFMTQMSDWLQAYNRQFYNNYLHAQASGLVVDGTADPMDGVDDSIFDGKSFSAGWAGVNYLSRPLRQRAYDSSAMGALYMDPGQSTYKYHAIQYPETSSGIPYTTTYKSLLFAEEVGVFDDQEDRADFIATTLDWMDVDPAPQQQVDMGIAYLDIPNHGHYWRSVEAMVPVELKVHVTNYGFQTISQVGVYLQLKNQFGQTLFENTLWSDTPFEDDPATSVNEGTPGALLPGETWAATFNRDNDLLQRIDDGTDPRDARHVIFTTAGMDRIKVKVVYYGGDKSGANADQFAPNDFMQASVGVSQNIENAELPENELGKTVTFADTDYNGGSSLDHYNIHRVHDYDWDQNPSTANESERSTVHQGEYAFGWFNKNGWTKSNGDTVFTPEPNQDDVWTSPELDWSGMDEVVMGTLFTGRMESGECWRNQIKKTSDSAWTTLISLCSFAPSKGSWYLWGGGNNKYQGYTLPGQWYGDEDSIVQMQFMHDADSDEVSERGGLPTMGLFNDNIVWRGTERVTKDLSVTDISVRADGFKKFTVSDPAMDRELNATVLNVGESSWTEQPIDVTITNLQGVEIYSDTLTIPGTLEGNAFYGYIEAEDHESETALFVKFTAPEANTYFAEFNARVAENRDQFPWNNSMVTEFRVFNTFFMDNAEDPAVDMSNNDVDWNTDSSEWFQVKPIDYDRGYAKSGQRAYYFTNPPAAETYESGTDSGMVTPDEFDRDGAGTKYDLADAIDLRAAYRPELEFAYQHDLGLNDRFLVQASSSYSSDSTPEEDDWTTLAEYDGTTPGWGSSWEWQSETLDLSDYSGFLVWLQFRVIADTGNDVGQGVLIDDIAVIGSEYRNNVDIVKIATDQFSSAGEAHELAVTVKNIGVVEQSNVRVEAQIVDADGDKVWPAAEQWLRADIPVTLDKGESYTIDGDESRWSDWVWGEDQEPGIYTLKVATHLFNDPEDLNDEDPDGNYQEISLVLGAALLGPEDWNGDPGWDTGKKDQGEYQWTGGASGALTSDPFTVWNNKPVLIMDASYDLGNSEIVGQVRAKSAGGGSWSAWYDIYFRDSAVAFFHAIDGKTYDTPPDSWTDSSDYEGKTRHTFWGDLGRVVQISDGFGNLEEKYVGGTLQIRLQAYKDGRASDSDPLATFYTPSIFGMESLGVELKEIKPAQMNGEPSPLGGDPETVSYNVKARNLGASKDFVVLDLKVIFPNGSFLFEDANGNPTVQLTSPESWDRPGPDGTLGTGDDIKYGRGPAWISQTGQVTYPGDDGLPGTSDDVSGTTAPLGWGFFNPTKGRVVIPESEKFEPGQVRTIGIEIQMGYSNALGGAVPGDYIVEVKGHSFEDSDVTSDTVTATLTVDRPDLTIGEFKYTTHVLISSDTQSVLTFWVEILNKGTETTAPFVVDLKDSGFATMGLSIFVMYNSAAQSWNVLDDAGDGTWGTSTSDGMAIRTVEGHTYLTFNVDPATLGVVPDGAEPAEFVFYLSVDSGKSIPESNEGNNEEYITITAVPVTITTPSFSLSLALTGLAGLVAALGIAYSRREEDEELEL